MNQMVRTSRPIYTSGTYSLFPLFIIGFDIVSYKTYNVR